MYWTPFIYFDDADEVCCMISQLISCHFRGTNALSCVIFCYLVIVKKTIQTDNSWVFGYQSLFDDAHKARGRL